MNNIVAPDTVRNAREYRRVRMKYRRGEPLTTAVTNSAVKYHNHKLLHWLVKVGAPIRHEHSREHPSAAWTAIQHRNVEALRHVELLTEHFLEVALCDDINFLGAMLNAKREHDDLVSLSFTAPTPIRVGTDRFILMLNDDHDAGYDGFWWLLRHDMIDQSEFTALVRRGITERYGALARQYFY